MSVATVTHSPPRISPDPPLATGVSRGIQRSSSLTALATVVVSAAIVWSLFSEAWTFISQVEWSRLGGDNWAPRLAGGQFSLKTIMMASFIVTGIAMLVASPGGPRRSDLPLGVRSSARARSILKPILEILAGIPSVVLGFFALLWIAPNIVG